MEQLNFSQYIAIAPTFFGFLLYAAIIPSILCVLVIVLTSFMAKRETDLLSQQLTTATILLKKTIKERDHLQEKVLKNKEFKSSLDVAELTTKLQKPRLDGKNSGTGNFIPEKYLYIQALAEKGMSVEEIASVLTISTHEAHQLVNLSKLAQGNISDNITDLDLRK